jgi:hypothetical protein
MREGFIKILVIVGGLAGIFISGFVLEKGDYFHPLKNYLQNRSVPTGMLNSGFLGKNLKYLGLVQTVPNDFSRFSKDAVGTLDPNANIFQKKRQVTDRLFEANPDGFSPKNLFTLAC